MAGAWRRPPTPSSAEVKERVELRLYSSSGPSWPVSREKFTFTFNLQSSLTLNLLTTTIVAPPSNASKWQMGFNSAFKGLSAFAKFRPANVSFPAPVSLSAVRTKPLGSHWTDFPENMYLGLQLK